MNHIFTAISIISLCLFACKSEPTKTDQKAADMSEVVGAPTKVLNDKDDINTSTSTTDVKRYDNPYQADGCTFVTDDIFKQVFGVEVSKDVNKQGIPGKGHCIWTWMKPNWMEIDNANEKKGAVYREFKNTMNVRVVNFGTSDAALAQYKVLTEQQKESYAQVIEGIGEAAVWNEKDGMLAVKKAHLIAHIYVVVSETTSENLAKAKAIAAAAFK
jgi:hypothetical protein